MTLTKSVKSKCKLKEADYEEESKILWIAIEFQGKTYFGGLKA